MPWIMHSCILVMLHNNILILLSLIQHSCWIAPTAQFLKKVALGRTGEPGGNKFNYTVVNV